MNAIIMPATDLTGASFSVALFGLVATSALLLMATGWTTRGWKLVLTLCAMSCLVGALALYEARAAWFAAKSVPIAYHYVGWFISMPLQVIALYFFVRQAGTISISLFWRLLIVSVLMVLVRYLGDAGLMHATLAFLIGLIFWLYLLGELYFGQMDEAVVSGPSDALRTSYFWLRMILTVGWAIYPLGSFVINFASYTDTGGLSLTYNLADFVNRMAFGLAVLAGALTTEVKRHED